MVKLYQSQTPDERQRHSDYLAQRELQRKLRLDAVFKQKNDDIKAQTQEQTARKLQLDQNSVSARIETEKARGLELGRRREFQPSPSPAGRFTDRLEPGRAAPPPQPTVGFERLTAEEQQTSFGGGFPLNLEAPERKAQHLWLRRAGQLTQEGLSVEEALDRAQAEVGPAIAQQFTPEQRGGLAGRFERGAGRLLNVAGKAGQAFQFATDPEQIVSSAATSLERENVTGQTAEQQRRRALLTANVAATTAPSFTEIQEAGAEVSRPVVRPALRGVAEVVEQVEKPLGVEGVVSDKLRSQLAEDIATEIFNPINIALAAPFAMQGTAGLRGVRLAEQIASNLLATGLEPALVRGTLRGFSLLGRRGLTALQNIPEHIKRTPTFRQVVKDIERGGTALDISDEAAGLRFAGDETAITHADLPTAPNVVDAPTSGFHGTGAKFEAFEEGALDTTALYGPGVYITDDVSIATSYATRRARQVTGASPTVQTVTARPGLKLLNMERPLPDEAIAAIERIAEADVGETADALFEGVRVAREGAPGKDVYREIRNELRREELLLSAGDAGEVLEGVNLALKESGFDGITHIGGIRGGKPHRVSVLFDPADATVSSGTIPLGPRQADLGTPRLPGDETAATPPLRGQPVRLPDELAPPREPLGPTEIPERGSSGAQQVLDFKEETLLKPGRATQFPGVKQTASGLNPSVSAEREILVSYNARQAAAASLETEFAAARQSPLDELKTVFRDEPPLYRGPDDNPFKNTLKDWGDNPEFYTLTERHRAAAAAYNAVGDQTLARSSGEFGVKVEPFPVKEGGFFSPTVATKESLDEGLKKVSEGYTSASVVGKGARTKTRVFEGAYQRWQNNPAFRAETNLDELTGLHDRALSKLAGDETFRLGAGGQTRLELMEQLHPALFQRMTGLRNRLASLRGTAGRLNKKLGEAIDSFLSVPDDVPLSDLADALDVTITRGVRKGMNVKAINAEIRAVRQEIRKLRPAWESANLEPFVLNRKTFRFHQPEQSAAIDKILQTKLNIGQGFADAIDEVRLTAFAGDVSPLTIQGLLGGLSHPLTTATNARNIVKSLWSPDELLRIATREPELVERFTVATGRPFGEVGPEFVQRFKGVERARIPFTKLRPGHALNRRLMAAVEEIRYSAWKTDQDLLRKLNPGMTQNVADAESANFLSKMIPALNPAETGRSVLRARFERIPFISTSFLASPPALVKDMASGLAKLGASTKLSPLARWQALSGREQLAIMRGLNLAGSLSALTVASYVASGFSPEEAVKKALDPTGNNPRFLSIAIGKDRFIPIGGPVRSFIRGLIPEKAGTAAGVPIYTPFTNTQKWLLGKVTPAIKAPIDIARNEDFFGGKIATGSFPENILRAVWYAANSILPLAAAEPSEAIRRGEVEPTDIGELAIRGGGQLAGSDVRELRLREAFERETGRSFSETPSALRRQLIADSPFLTRLAEQQEVFFPDEGKRVRTERSAELLPHAQAALQGGLEAVRAYNDNRKFIMAKFGGVSEEVFGDLDIEPKGRDNELLSQYYEVDFRADQNGNGIPGDDDDVRLALEEQDGLKAQMSPDVQDALNNPANFFIDKEVIEYEGLRREGVDVIREILKLPKWQGLTVEEGDTLDDLVSRIQADVQRYKAQATREEGDPAEVTFRSTAEWLVSRGAITELDAENAIAVSSGKALRDAGRVNLALERRDILLRTFPDFFGSVLPAETERAALTGEEIEQLQPAGVR